MPGPRRAPTMTSLHLPLALAFALAATPAQDAPDPPSPYPPGEVQTLVRFYTLEGKQVNREKLESALKGLGEGGSVIYGPEHSPGNRDDWFVAIEAPADVKDKDVTRAAKKGTGRAELLSVSAFAFDLDDAELPRDVPRGFGNVRDLVIGMASEMRWFEITPTHLIFLYGKGFDAEDCSDRFQKLLGRKPLSDPLRDIMRHSVTWDLSPGEKWKASKASRVEKTLEKIAGVRGASLDAEALRLHLTLQVADIQVVGPAWSPPAPPVEEEEDDDEGGRGGRRGGRGRRMAMEEQMPFLPRVNVNPILEALQEAHLFVQQTQEAEVEDSSGAEQGILAR